MKGFDPLHMLTTAFGVFFFSLWYRCTNCGKWKCWVAGNFWKPLATVAGEQKS